MGITVTAYSPYEGYPDPGYHDPGWAVPVPQPAPQRKRRKRKLLGAFIGLGGAHLHWLSLALLVLGTLVMDAAVQSSNLLGQSVIYELLPSARSRITAIYMTTMFIGGSLGSWAAAHAFDRWGWAGACIAAAAFPAVGLLAWLGAARHERRNERIAVTTAS